MGNCASFEFTLKIRERKFSKRIQKLRESKNRKSLGKLHQNFEFFAEILLGSRFLTWNFIAINNFRSKFLQFSCANNFSALRANAQGKWEYCDHVEVGVEVLVLKNEKLYPFVQSVKNNKRIDWRRLREIFMMFFILIFKVQVSLEENFFVVTSNAVFFSFLGGKISDDTWKFLAMATTRWQRTFLGNENFQQT